MKRAKSTPKAKLAPMSRGQFGPCWAVLDKKSQNSSGWYRLGPSNFWFLIFSNFLPILAPFLRPIYIHAHTRTYTLYTTTELILVEGMGAQGGGVLRYISDGDVRSPFLGLKCAIWGLFLGLTFRSDFFGWEILVRTFLEVDKKRNPGFSFLCQTIVSWRKNCLELSWIILYFFGVTFCAVGLFLGQGLAWRTFFGSNNCASFAHPRH